MKVIKSVDLDRDGINITETYRRELQENCSDGSTKYKNCMQTFKAMLQEVADKAFKLGRDNGG